MALNSIGKIQIVGLARPGQILGLPQVHSGFPASHSAIVSSAGVVCRFSAASLKTAQEQDGELSRNLLSALARRQCEAESQLLSLGSMSAAVRIIQLLLDLSGSGEMVTALSRTELSQLAGTTLETASRTVRGLERSNYIKLTRRLILIQDREALERMAMQGCVSAQSP
ncbi:MAG: Crp/Fnr family transcriptional regulator [Vulcanimicrobiota bacterium]